METDILDKGREYIQQGQLEKAQIILKRALNENPNSAETVELSGDLAVKLGRNDDAISRYEQACDNYTYNNKYAEAIISLEKILKIDKTYDDVVFRLADLYKFFGLPNEAIKKILKQCTWSIEKKEESIFVGGLRKIVELQPKNLSLRLSFAKILLSLNRSQEAHDELKKLKGLAEEAGDEHILEEVKKFLPQYDGGEELDPKSRIELGNLLYEIGSKDEAIVEFNKAVGDLIQGGEVEEAINVLNRIIEIDPNNTEAINKLAELKGIREKPAEGVAAMEVEPPEAKTETPHEEVIPEAHAEETITKTPSEEIIPEAPVQAAEEVVSKETPPQEAEEVAEFLQGLSKEVDGFIAASESGTEQEATAPVQPEELPQLEGQIADIEFLLKEAEAAAAPSLEIGQEFENFRNIIVWESEDSTKKLNLAKVTYDAELYEAALSYIGDTKDNKAFWPLSLEIISGSWIKLGNYNEAIKIIGEAIIHEEIPETQKVELRYLLVSAYEGLGDFENALREIEHIMTANPQYKDVKELYALLGGKKIFEEPKVVTEEPVKKEEVPTTPVRPEVIEKVPAEEPPIEKAPAEKPPQEKTEEYQEYPTIIEEVTPPEGVPEKLPKEISDIEEKTENIAFL